MPKTKQSYRVVVLGDSITFGKAVALEERYTNVAERLLAAQFSRLKIEVLNFGIDGAPTVFERDVFRSWKNTIQADRIVVGFCLNDPQPREQEYSEEKSAFDKRARFVLRPLFKILRMGGFNRTADRLKRGIYAAVEFVGLIPDWTEALDRVYDPNSSEWKEFVAALADIKKDSDGLGLPRPVFLVLNQAVYLDKPTDYAHPDELLTLYLKWYEQAEAAAIANGFETINVTTEIAARLPNRILAANAADAHPSADLHQIYGEKLAAVLRRELR